MTVTAFPTDGSPDLALLNVARLFTRLENNLLSPGTDRRSLQQSEYQRMRINKNVEYARTLLTQLERALPQLKPLDRKHEAQAEIARDRQLLKRIQSILDEEDAKAQVKQEDEEDDEENQDGEDEWKELFSKPISKEKVIASTSPHTRNQPAPIRTTEPQWDEMDEGSSTTTTSLDMSGPSITLTEATPTSATASSQLPTLRNRHTNTPSATPTSTSSSTSEKPTATTTSSNTNTQSKPATEKELSTHRMEQEDLTSSLLTLASQLKSSSKTFQSTLEGEKSALDRAVSGIDRTSTTMEAAGKRMGLLRKMTEGKGWWGRMMLYAWIFGLWVVAILIVFVGPKLRF
ncbi:hypothetical protein N7499_007810 [Penicillium canescens]|uniref:Synaptobrevin n=1 Tax=Penicillium canescens TaxID=5083 RepID=A0AAD6N1M7_PENCN|nr:uncharacterized protein N7446_012846 [Penicillium canescens]KAJ5985901.1 hypothetical protein N7522_013097 [Penicillium canescens]KAJ6022495.1 hypothetical protein N7460_012890 [Penicillium canescens]KAJ6026245.1 hypothetical protein N7444_013924 [Penicillium canescens]KAJ6041780.1 hypothetical protein N7446_012846 [Penicillium canescens]KAJ6075829.1 hypothetical protein N7499_007810 [Penicillium canescens]